MIKYPGVTMAGTVNDALVSQIDIMATLASVVGYDLPKKMLLRIRTIFYHF
jgi:arylsulfatase A